MPKKSAAAAATKKPLTKAQIITNITEKTGVGKKEVGAVIDGLTDEIKKSLSSRGAGSFAIPGLVKIEKKKVPARPARKNVPNPFKPGEFMDVAAKRASVKVKVRALKALRDMA